MSTKGNERYISYVNALDQQSLQTTFTLQEVDGVSIPFQGNIPYPSFEPQEREVLSLGGEWKKKRFAADHTWTMQKRTEKWVNVTERFSEGIVSKEFDDREWDTKLLPHPENALTGEEEVGAAETYEDGVWYRKAFFIKDEDVGKVWTLKCLGLSYVGDFWLNGAYIGHHEGGYTPFAYDATEYLDAGLNVLVIRVDNPPWTTRYDTVPATDSDFFNYTGVLQDLFLEAVPSVQVVRADVVPKGIDGKIEVIYVLENRSNQQQKMTIQPTVHETDYSQVDWLQSPNASSICKGFAYVEGVGAEDIVLDAKQVRVIRHEAVVKNPKLWSIRVPHLYVLGVSVKAKENVIDRFYTQFGIRSIATHNAQICLNETPLFLAGVARHEEWPEHGRTATWQRLLDDFDVIEKTHINMVRTAHYPNHIYTFLVLDRLGLTAMAEIPLWQFEKEHYEVQEARGLSYQMWREMIYSNYNRPSVILWSTQNESKEVALRKTYNEKLVHEVRSLYDDGRLITQSAAADQPGFEDESMEPLDVAGWTMYFGIFHGSTPYEGTRDFIEKAHQKWPDKPILNTEYGIWSNADESFLQKQVEIYEEVQLALLEKATVTPQGSKNKIGYLAGMDYWTVFNWYVNHNQFYQTMGIYHMDRLNTKPITNLFIKDHKRLTSTYQGLALGDTLVEPVALAWKAEVSRQTTLLSLEGPVDLTQWNYLQFTMKGIMEEQRYYVQFFNETGASCSYTTFKPQAGETYDVYIPIWKLNQAVVDNLQSVKIYHEGTNEICEIVCAQVATR